MAWLLYHAYAFLLVVEGESALADVELRKLTCLPCMQKVHSSLSKCVVAADVLKQFTLFVQCRGATGP